MQIIYMFATCIAMSAMLKREHECALTGVAAGSGAAAGRWHRRGGGGGLQGGFALQGEGLVQLPVLDSRLCSVELQSSHRITTARTHKSARAASAMQQHVKCRVVHSSP